MREIHPTALIDSSVELGRNVRIGPYSVIRANVVIGDNTYISSHVSIGEEAEHSSDKYELHPRADCPPIYIGKNVVLREFTTVNRPMSNLTLIADDVYIMARVHVGHDCRIEAGAVLSNNAILSGWTRVLRGATLGICVATHQFTTIGQYAMVAANATVVKDVVPLAKYIPGKELSLNAYAVRKWGLPARGETLEEVRRESFYRWLLDDWEAARDTRRPVYGIEAWPADTRLSEPLGPDERTVVRTRVIQAMKESDG
jgi:UDP-N-acetylglucosamine acyltransferase